MTGWRRTSFNGRDDVWVADVSALKLKSQLPLLFHDGASMTLCRYPNADPRRPYSGGWAYVPGKAVSMYREIEGERDDEVPVRPEASVKPEKPARPEAPVTAGAPVRPPV